LCARWSQLSLQARTLSSGEPERITLPARRFEGDEPDR
jgi:hypothetical protein